MSVPDPVTRMKVFREARPASAGRNLALTACQAVVFWTVFLGVLPWCIHRFEVELGIPGFDFAGQGLLGASLLAALAVLNLSAGYTMAVVGRGTPFPTATARELVVRGPYRYVRNPMAIGGLGAAVAIGLWLGSWLTIVYAVAGGVVWNTVARPLEERDLHARFGEPYAAYRDAVPCWLPRLTPY